MVIVDADSENVMRLILPMALAFRWHDDFKHQVVVAEAWFWQFLHISSHFFLFGGCHKL